MDLPELLQQMKGRPRSGEYLEVLGKHAAAEWSGGRYKTLTESVTAAVKEAQLSPEQVKRVVEFANTSAYLDEFKKEGAPHRVVDFPGGPADTGEILRDLNDGGGGAVNDNGLRDYSKPPKEGRAIPNRADEELQSLFGSEKTAALIPYENPYSDVIEVRDKLAGAADSLGAQISGLEVMYAELGNRVFHQVKQATLNDTTLGEIMHAWQTVSPSDDHIKVAFTLITPRLLHDGVFHNVTEMTTSVDKVAGVRMVNSAHPIVTEFKEFCETLSKLAELREARSEIQTQLGSLNAYLKTAALAGDAYRAATRGSGAVASHVSPFVEKALGSGAGKVTKTLIEQAPNIGLGVAGMEGYTHLMHSQNPVARAARGTGNLIARNIPGTQAHLIHQYEVESGQ
jgi:hypothetical protein